MFTIISIQVPRKTKRKVNRKEYVVVVAVFVFPFLHNHHKNRQKKNMHEMKLKKQALDLRRKREIEERERERRHEEKRRTKKTYKRLKKVSKEDEEEQKKKKKKKEADEKRKSTETSTKKKKKKKSTKKESKNKTVTTTTTTSKRSGRKRSSKKKEEKEDELEDEVTILRNPLGDDETVDVSIIAKEAAIQLPLANHAQEWESMTEDEHPEDVVVTKCKTLKENFSKGKVIVMQLPMDLPNSIDNISSDVQSNMPQGIFGDLRLHQSGKVTVKTRKGIVLNVTGGIVDRMSELALQVDMEKHTVIALPRIEGHLVFHPNYNSLIGDSSFREEEEDEESNGSETESDS